MNACPCCSALALSVFYEVPQVPVHSVLRIPSREEALRFPTGRLQLAFCSNCGFITNAAIDPSMMNYSAEYEETQGFSATFNAFHKRLAEDLIRRHDLHGKTVVEIGCGKGEFLTMICELGGNKGIGFDPAYVPERNQSASKEDVTFIEDFYSEKYSRYHGDLVGCKMTLEHIHQPAELIETVRRSIGERHETVVFFQVPDTRRVLRDLAFWDIYYEHCSYFSPASLARLFESQGFDVMDVWTDYDDQYLMIEAKPAQAFTRTSERDKDVARLAREVEEFAEQIQQRLGAWRALLTSMKKAGRRVVLWGGGSKAVAFLTTLGVTDEVAFAVDINPYKHGTFLAMTGHEVVGPATLVDDQPDVVIIMNPIYREEIRNDLAAMDLAPALFDIDQDVAPEHAL